MRAADVHQAQIIEGVRLSRDDFLNWAADCWDRQENHRKTHEAQLPNRKTETMATKNNPGPYDCYANAEPDEPMFVLLGRDATAALVVTFWVALRQKLGKTEPEKLEEARRSHTMRRLCRDDRRHPVLDLRVGGWRHKRVQSHDPDS